MPNEDLLTKIKNFTSHIRTHEQRNFGHNYCHTFRLRYKNPPVTCVTRWNSTLHLLKWCIKYKRPLDKFSIENAQDWRITNSEWRNLETLIQFLENFERCTRLLSGVYYPTINLALRCIALLSREMVNNMHDPYIGSIVKSMIPTFIKYWQPIPPIFILAAALDPTQNVVSAESNVREIKENFLTLTGQEVPSFIVLCEGEECKLREVFHQYASIEANTSQQQRKSKGKGLMSRFNRGTTSAAVRNTNVERELNTYIWTEPEDEPEDELFDVLAYWKGATDKPILSKIARDVLSAQASSCASERCFSASGRILSSRRMSLRSDILEACICFKDYWDSTYRQQDAQNELDKISRDFQLVAEEGHEHQMGAGTENEDDEDEGSSNSSYPSEEDYCPSAQYYYTTNFAEM